jgi:ABC-2 type transport system permease protein
MKGLLMKDLLYIRQMWKVLVIIFAVYVALFAVSGVKNIGSGADSIIVMMTVILTINTFAYDEKSNWDGFGLSLPISRKQTVVEKYVLVLLFSGCISVLMLAASLAGGGFTSDYGINIFAGFGIALLFPAILIPLFYKFGMQSARIGIMLFFIVPVLAIAAWKKVGLPLPSLTDAAVMQFLWFSPVLVFVLYLISFLISCAVYSNKEF